MTAAMTPSCNASSPVGDGAALFPPCPIQPRLAVSNIQAYHPPLEGRRPYARLDFNENTQGFPEAYPANTPKHLINTYPEYQDATNALARFWELDPAQVLLCNGSDEGLAVIASTFIEPKVSRALISDPSFVLIHHYLKLAEAQVEQVPVLQPSLAFDLEKFSAALKVAQNSDNPVKLVILASPDNPTGALLPLAQVESWCTTYPHTLFVMDEAYADYLPLEASAVQLLDKYPNLLVTRTFSKAWGMAGLRLGVVLGHPQLIEAMKRVRSPYSVNVMALNVLETMLLKGSDVKVAAAETMSRKAQLEQQVEAMGYPVIRGHGNFFLVAAGIDAPVLAKFCQEQGVLVRDRSSHPALKGLFRVSVGTEAESQKLLKALEVFRESRALIFDLDDTLVDTQPSFSAIILELVDHFTQKPATLEELRDLRAGGGYNDDWRSAQELIRRRGLELDFETVKAEGQTRYLARAKDVEVMNVDYDVLKTLAKRYRLFIATGRARCEYAPIWGDRLDPLFEQVYCADDVAGTRKKPHPDLMIHIKTFHNLKSGFYIGNNVDDMVAALAADLDRIAVATTLPEQVLYDAGAQWVIPGLHNMMELMTR